MSMLSDYIGRKNTILLSLSIAGGSVFACGFAMTIDMFNILIFLAGFGFSGFETIIYSYVTEISGII